MDFSPIINQVVGIFLYIIPIMIVIGIFKHPLVKGAIGEYIVNLSARLLLDKEEYHLIKNVILPIENGSTQIDHIIVSKFGIFVIETKNMKGWIFGCPSQNTWTQKIYKHSSKFQNPLHQNYKHTKTLESFLGLDKHQVHSVIVFVGDSTFKTQMPENVRQGWSYIKYIKSKKQPIFTESQVYEILEKIENKRIMPSFKANREHVKNVKKAISKKYDDNAPKCPICSSIMILREAKKGQNMGKKFWGCSDFSKCRGIRNLKT